MKYFCLVFRHLGIYNVIIYLHDSIMLFVSKAAYRFTIYKRSIHSSIFEVVKYVEANNLVFKTYENSHTISFPVNGKEAQAVLRKKGSDVAVFREIFILNEYKPLIDKIVEKKINVRNIIDAGSNIGLTALYFAQFFPDASIVSVEPDTQNVIQLKKNCDLNRINCFIEMAGLWSKGGTLKIKRDFRYGDSWSLRVTEDEKDGDVRACTINELMAKYNFSKIDILKIDIEGSEVEIFKNTDICTFLKDTRLICVETHKEVGSFSTVVNTLAKYDFEMFFNAEVIFGLNRKLI